MIDDDILNCPFIPCAFAAFVRQAQEDGGWPDMRKTQQRAYRMFEDKKRKQDPAAELDQ